MRNLTILIIALAVSSTACKREEDVNAERGTARSASSPETRLLIRNIVAKPERDTTVTHVLVTGDTIVLSRPTVLYYRSILRRGKPVWSSGVKVLPRASEMVEELGKASEDGLEPARYEFARAQAALQSAQGNLPDSLVARHLADLDLVLTEGFNRYASDLTRGSIDPVAAGLDWKIPRARPWEENLLRMMIRGTPPADVVERLRPQNPYYKRMLGALARHRAIKEKGGWPVVAKGKLLKGDSSAAAGQVRARMLASEDPREVALARVGEARPMVYDEQLNEALRHFQDRHALEPDGALGDGTLRELNQTIDSRLSELMLNIDRWRWLPHDLGKFFVLVNVAGFELEVIENDVAIERMNVVVGQPGWKTPIFQDTMEHIVVNPSWNVPESIMQAEVRPAMARNPNYLAEHNMELTKDGTARQLPGPDNALGDYKFIFPNKDNIYLHDTPSQ